jgi:hypothetical protein
LEVHQSARRHGVADVDINHAIDHALVVVDVDADSDPPKVLVIGPDRAGNLLEVMVLELADERFLVIHAMSLRPSLQHLLPEAENPNG